MDFYIGIPSILLALFIGYVFGRSFSNNKSLQLIIQNLKIMATKIDELKALLVEVDESTNNIAADISRLADQAEEAGGLDEVVTGLRAASEKLKLVAAVTPE